MTMEIPSEDLKRVMRRLRKVLALSNSTEPGEAAAALHQAQSIMAKYGLEREDAEMSAIEEKDSPLGGSEIHPWEGVLVTTVNKALGVMSMYTHQTRSKGHRRPRASITFVGEAPRGQMAAYAFDVLRRQLRNSMANTFETLSQGAGPGFQAKDIRKLVTRSQREAYANAWALAVFTKIQSLAAPVPETVKSYVARKNLSKAEQPKPRQFRKNDPLRNFLMTRGFQDGASAQLHQAMDKSTHQHALIEIQPHLP